MNFEVGKLAVLHEAGHASVALFLGFPSCRVELYRFKDGVQLDPGATVVGIWQDPNRVLPIDAVLYLLAGTAAERLLVEQVAIFPDLAEQNSLRLMHREEDEIRSRDDREKAFIHATAHCIKNADSIFSYENVFISLVVEILERNLQQTIEIYKELRTTGKYGWDGNS
jgi:hypothetical protein